MIDGHDVVEAVKTVLEEGNKKEPKGLEPKSIYIGFVIFFMIGFSHSYSFRTTLISSAVLFGILGTKLLLWNLRNQGVFKRYDALLFETVPLAVMHYASGWLLRVVCDYFGWITP